MKQQNPNDSTGSAKPSRKKRFSDSIRQTIDDLQAEDQLQTRITSRILGAAAQISDNHERLIEQVAEVARDDLEKMEALSAQRHTPEGLKQEFQTLNCAKAHFEIKARSWSALAKKLNGTNDARQSPAQHSAKAEGKRAERETELSERLARLEEKLEKMQADLSLVLQLLSTLIHPLD